MLHFFMLEIRYSKGKPNWKREKMQPFQTGTHAWLGAQTDSPLVYPEKSPVKLIRGSCTRK